MAKAPDVLIAFEPEVLEAFKRLAAALEEANEAWGKFISVWSPKPDAR